MTRRLPVVALVVAGLAASPLFAQRPNPFADPAEGRVARSFDEIADLKAEIVPAKAKRGEVVTFRITITPKPKAWTYPTNPKDPDQLARNKIAAPPPADLIFVGTVNDPPGLKEKPREGAAPGKTDEYYPLAATWELKAVVSPRATPGKKKVTLDELTQIQACNKDTCLSPRKPPSAEFEVEDGEVPVPAEFKQAVAAALTPSPATPPTPNGPRAAPTGPTPSQPEKTAAHAAKVAKPTAQIEEELAAILKQLDKTGTGGISKEDKTGLWAFVATAALWGLISLVTPCVFPMIPITVSIFLKQAHGSLAERLKLAAVYCLTIILVLGVSAFALLKFMAFLSAHPVTNLLLGLLFLVLALSLFGMYDLTLPNFMARRLQAKQAKGGVVGTVFGALAFTVISFTCVAPFLGGFAGISAADSAGGSLITVPTTRELLGGLAFATAFAAPFFILALVPGLLRALPKSGGWLDSVKVVMGFLELAAALKFLRTAELRVFSPPEYFTYDLVLGGWVAICLACGLYLLNVYRLPHDEERPNIGVPRLLFALLFLGLGVYLLPAVFKGAEGKGQRPAGAVFAWVDAFLLPEPGQRSDLEWGTDLKDALDKVRRGRETAGVGKPVIVDFTGVTCSNCRYNEEQIFTMPVVRELLLKFERVQLYTDDVPASFYATNPGDRARKREAVANRDFKIDAFGTDQLPVYVILLPKVGGGVEVVEVYPEAKINDPDKFVAFLKNGLEAAKK